MSYEEPTEDDRETLLDFYSRLRASFDRETNHDLTVDLLKTDFDWFLNPEEHTEWSPPFPPMGRREFQSWDTEKRKREVRAAGREHIQDTMEDAALLAHMHGVDLGDIEGLEQSDGAIRQKIQQERSGQQAKIVDY
jgi:hypothetical protein